MVGQIQVRNVKKTNIQRINWIVQTGRVSMCVQVCAAPLWAHAPLGAFGGLSYACQTPGLNLLPSLDNLFPFSFNFAKTPY